MIRNFYFFFNFIFLFSSCTNNSTASKKQKSVDNFDVLLFEEYVEQEEMDSALNYIDEFYKNNPDDINILIARADFYSAVNQNKTSISRDCLEHCLEIEPKNIICAEKRINLYCTLYDVTGNSCEESVNYVLDFDSKNLIALYFQAKLRRDQGKTELAKQIYQQILEIKANHLGALEDLAILYTQENNELAITYFDRILEQNPTYQVYYNYGYYFQSQEDFQNAIQKYQESISLNESWPYSYYSMGYCYLASALYSKDKLKKKSLLNSALKSFDKTINLDGGYLEAYHSRAICHQNIGNKKAALEDFKFCLMINPGYEPAMNGISELEKSN